MKFRFVDEKKYNGKIKLIPMRKIALGISSRCYNADMSDLIDPILIIAKQNNLNIKVEERMVCGKKIIYFEYQNEDIVKAVHILNVCTILN